MDSLRQDLRFALRALLREPLFTLVAVASLAVGIGATTSIFSAVHVLAVRPVPGVGGWERAVEIGGGYRGRGFDTFSWPNLADLREQASTLEEVAGWRSGAFSLGTGEGGVRIQGQYVTANYFDALGVTPARGRLFGSGESRVPGDHPVVVVSHRFWQTHLEGAPDAVGTTLRLNRRPVTVVGVTPRDFGGHYVGVPVDLFVPLGMVPSMGDIDAPVFERRDASFLQAVGRLAPGATVEEASAEVAGLMGRLADAHPEANRNRTARVMALGPIPGAGRAPALGFLGALTGLVVLVLLVTCANVAGMFLARAASREREVAIRLAIGSGRARLVRKLLTEAVAIFLLGGLGGVALASWGMGLVDFASLPIPVELSLDLSPDPRVLLVGLGVALLTGVLFGLAPALQAAGTDILSSLKADAGRGGGRVSRMRKAFAAGQVGLSLVLLVAAGLFLRSLQEAADIAKGFDPEDAYATSLDLGLEGYDAGSGRVFLERLTERVRGIPGVETAAVGMDLPLDLSSHGTSVLPEGWEGGGAEDHLGVEFNHVTPGWFSALGIPLLAGRGFDEGDREGAPGVAVVSRTFAERAWPGEDPLGRTFRYLQDGARSVTVVGVVEDTRNQTLMDEDVPFVYRPLAQAYDGRVTVVVRTARAHEDVAGALRSAILEVDPSVSLAPVHSVEGLTSIGVLPQRIGATVASALGAVALLLAGLGVYGVVALFVTGRTREIGIRMALGAGRARVLGEVVKAGLALALPGLAVGAILAALVSVGLSRLNVLLGVPAADPLALGAVAGLLLGVVLLASAVPARRASRVAPAEALRHE